MSQKSAFIVTPTYMVFILIFIKYLHQKFIISCISMSFFIYSNTFYYLRDPCKMLQFVCRQCVVYWGMRSFVKNMHSQHECAMVFFALSLLTCFLTPVKSTFGYFPIPINIQVQLLNNRCILTWKQQPVCPNLTPMHFQLTGLCFLIIAQLMLLKL